MLVYERKKHQNSSNIPRIYLIVQSLLVRSRRDYKITNLYATMCWCFETLYIELKGKIKKYFQYSITCHNWHRVI